MMDITLAGAAEAIQTALHVLQDVLTEETLAFFAEPYTVTTEKAGRRILQIGPLLYSEPPDVLLICLWEPLGAIHPEAARNAERLRALVRPDVLEVVEAVTQKTTWDELEGLIHAWVPAAGPRGALPGDVGPDGARRSGVISGVLRCVRKPSSAS